MKLCIWDIQYLWTRYYLFLQTKLEFETGWILSIIVCRTENVTITCLSRSTEWLIKVSISCRPLCKRCPCNVITQRAQSNRRVDSNVEISTFFSTLFQRPIKIIEISTSKVLHRNFLTNFNAVQLSTSIRSLE